MQEFLSSVSGEKQNCVCHIFTNQSCIDTLWSRLHPFNGKRPQKKSLKTKGMFLILNFFDHLKFLNKPSITLEIQPWKVASTFSLFRLLTRCHTNWVIWFTQPLRNLPYSKLEIEACVIMAWWWIGKLYLLNTILGLFHFDDKLLQLPPLLSHRYSRWWRIETSEQNIFGANLFFDKQTQSPEFYSQRFLKSKPNQTQGTSSFFLTYRSESQSRSNIFITGAFDPSFLVIVAVLCVGNSAVFLLPLHWGLKHNLCCTYLKTQFFLHLFSVILGLRNPLLNSLSHTRTFPTHLLFFFILPLFLFHQAIHYRLSLRNLIPEWCIVWGLIHRYCSCVIKAAYRTGGHLSCGPEPCA